MENLFVKIHKNANYLFYKKNYKCAILLYNFMIFHNYKSDIMYSNISACYLKLKNYLLALDNSLKSIEINLNNSISWGRIGYSYKALNMDHNAYKAFEIALTFDKNNKLYKKELENYFNKFNNKLNFSNISNLIKNNNEIYSKVKELKQNFNKNNMLEVIENIFEKL